MYRYTFEQGLQCIGIHSIPMDNARRDTIGRYIPTQVPKMLEINIVGRHLLKGECSIVER